MSLLSRRIFTLGMSAAATGLAVPGAARAQVPAGDIHFICAFAAGSGADVIVRFMAEKVRAVSGRSIVVENKPGAIGNIATEYVARAKPDGLTVLVHGGSSLAANMHLFKNPPVDAGKAFEIVGTLMRQPVLLVVRGDSPLKSVAELTAEMKKKGDKGTYGTAFPTARVAAALYKERAGLQTVDVAYKTSADWVNDLNSGAIDFAVVDTVFGLAQAKQGRMKVLAASTADRISAMKDTPTLTELGYPMDIAGWWATFVPAATPKPALDQLREWIGKAGADPATGAFFASIGGESWLLPPAEAKATYLKEIDAWGDYVRIAKIEKQG